MKLTALLALLLALRAAGEPVQVFFVPQPVITKRLASYDGTNADRATALSALFAEAGCSGDRLTEQIVSKKKPPNLICTLPGETDSVIVVGAHFDFVGLKKGKGVIDNWTGASLLPSLFEGLKDRPRRHTFVFVGFTEEEQGLVGSRHYVSKLGKENRRKIAAMVNLDSLGAGPTKFETDRSDRRLTDPLFAVSGSLKIPLNIVNVHLVGRSDSDSFQNENVPAINIHSLTRETFPILHGPRDQMEAVQMDDYYGSYRLILVYLGYLDNTLSQPAGTVESK